MHMINKIFNSLEKLASFKRQENQAIGEMEKVAVTFLKGLANGLSKARRAAMARGRTNFLKDYGLTLDRSGKMVALSGTKLSDKLAAQQKALLDTQRIADVSKWSDEMKQLHSAYNKAGRDAKQAVMAEHGLTTRTTKVGVDAKGNPILRRSLMRNGKAKLSAKKNAQREQWLEDLRQNKALSEELKNLNAKGSATLEEIKDIAKRYNLNPSNFKGQWNKLITRQGKKGTTPDGKEVWAQAPVALNRGKIQNVYPNAPKPKPGPKPPTPTPPEPVPPGPNPPGPNPPGPNPPGPNPPGPNPPSPNPPGPKPPTPEPGPKPPSPTPDVPPGGGAGTNIITNTDKSISQTLNSTSNQIFNGGNSYINKGTMINGNGNAIGSTIGSGNFTGPAPITKPVTPPKPTPKTPEPKKAVEPELPGQYGPTSPAPASAPVGPDLLGNNWWKYGLTGAGGFLLGRATD